MKEEKEGRIAEIIFHNKENAYSVLLFDDGEGAFTAVGYMPRPAAGRSFHLLGEWKRHPKFGEQFAFSSFEELRPTGLSGIEAFLSSGVIRGVGPITAKAITKCFGEKALDILEKSPELLTKVRGIGKVKAKAIAEDYAKHREYAIVVTALSAYGIEPGICFKLYKKYGPGAPDIIKENPYALVGDAAGIGFIKADRIAASIGFKEDSPLRVKSGIEYFLTERAGAGDTYAERTELEEKVAAFLDVPRLLVGTALEDLAMDGKVFIEKLDAIETVMLFRFYMAEKNVAYKLYELCHSELKYISGAAESLIKVKEASGLVLSEKQKEAVVASLQNGVSVITGGPGTGKTTIIKALLDVLEAEHFKTFLAAPTGRAAKRMESAAKRSASTVHRLLEYTFSEGDELMRFGKNSENPLECDCVIIDEASMVDILLMEALLDAIPLGTRLILVGDADQLPPVGPGNVLTDIISSEVLFCVRLTEIFRQASESMIVVNAHRINHGDAPDCNGKDTDFFFIPRPEEKIADTVRDLCVRRLPGFYKTLDPLTDIQVLTPTRKGPLGNAKLNVMLREALNPPSDVKAEKEFGERLYREGDKVMQNKNDYMLGWVNENDMSKGDGVFNGDIGTVRTVDEDSGTVDVLFDGEKLVTYNYENIDELEPAFAMTVHKSQGSEFPVVIMPCARFAPMLSTRNLLYTAVTRAKKGVVLVGSYDACRAMVENNSVAKRNSALGKRLVLLWDEGSFRHGVK